MVVVVAPPPEEMVKFMRAGKRLKTNIVQMRKAYKDWQLTKSNAALEPLLVEIVESIDSLYAMMKQHHPEEV